LLVDARPTKPTLKTPTTALNILGAREILLLFFDRSQFGLTCQILRNSFTFYHLSTYSIFKTNSILFSTSLVLFYYFL
jgi:hypothetical protein